ncbi:dTDP-4-amino-4,6-dideoxygalactose transaminase [Virgibacillus subterraneus]|uniref:dTDP-4-amino-4,6-dideoxygalactose transaminase n=1 Tax=Virgibacillus subterraneus TaxID=621109 RepID=UPI003CCC023B
MIDLIPFNKPCVIGEEAAAMQEAIEQTKLSGNGPFGKKCTDWLEARLQCEKVILTPSCTAALEMTTLLMEVGEKDEVIMPSYTFVSTANAFALRGTAIRFVDIEPNTMNISPDAIEAAITSRTKAIVVVHYAGISCDMDSIMDIANRYGLWVIEDAAQALFSSYNGKPLGTIGHFGAISFHETKNFTCGEGGALIVNHSEAVERAEILQEKGTNREQFFKGIVDKYTWRDVGSSYLLSDLNAAYLSVQLQHADLINKSRLRAWKQYYDGLTDLPEVEVPHVPSECQHNAHMFYIKTNQQQELIEYLKKHDIMAVTHYVPLHSSHAGKKFGKFIGEDQFTTTESEKIVRLPLYFGIGEEAVDDVVTHTQAFFNT